MEPQHSTVMELLNLEVPRQNLQPGTSWCFTSKSISLALAIRINEGSQLDKIFILLPSKSYM